ncbi:MAG: PAS domain S-box protein [Candidatus Thorarchaeota archaeon]|nr:PAS domain S-box protein [Candidatus Thorarchaeota archaeon]
MEERIPKQRNHQLDSKIDSYRYFFDVAPIAMGISDRNGVLIHANRALSEMLGYTVKQFMEMGFPGPLMDDSVVKKLAAAIGEKGEITDLDIKMKAADGRTLDVQVNVKPVEMNGETRYLASFRDMTELKQAQASSILSEKRFKQTFESIPNPAYIWEKKPDGTIVLSLINEAIKRISKGRMASIEGRGLEILDSNPELRDCVLQAFHSDDPIRNEAPIIVSGEERWYIWEFARPIDNMVLMITTDITERRKMENALRKSEQEKSIILDTMSEHVNYYGSPEMRIEWTNIVAAQSIGKKPDEIIGKRCYELWHGSTTPCAECPVIRANNSKQMEEGEMVTPDGRIWNIRGYPVLDDKDDVVGLVEVTREITEMKKAEQELRQAWGRAKFFTDLLSHDLNNIHQGIMTALEIVLLNPNLPSSISLQIETAMEQVKRGVKLITNVRKFSEIDSIPGALTPTDPYTVLQAAIETVRLAFPNKNLILKTNLKARDFEILADDFAFELFYNLAHNIMKHTRKNDVILDLQAKPIADGKFLEMAFMDHGPGFSQTLKKQVLDRIEMGGGPGSGIGLTLVGRITRRYGGGISIEDRVPGDRTQGSRVVVTLPLVKN